MNINLNIPLALVERIASSLESIAHSLQSWVKPPAQQTEPYGKEYFSVSTAQSSYEQEVEDFFSKKGHGQSYREFIEQEALSRLKELEHQDPDATVPSPPDLPRY